MHQPSRTPTSPDSDEAALLAIEAEIARQDAALDEAARSVSGDDVLAVRSSVLSALEDSCTSRRTCGAPPVSFVGTRC